MNKVNTPQNLIDKIEKAMSRVYYWPEIAELIDLEQTSALEIARGKTDKKLEKKVSNMQKKIPSLIVYTLVELEYVFDYIGMESDIKNGTLQKLYFQSVQGIDKGYKTRFSIWFYKPVKGTLAMYSAVQFHL